MLDKEFVPYAESLALRELGFDEPCSLMNQQIIYRNSNLFQANKDAIELFIRFEDEIVIAPTFSQAFRFFRDKYELNHEIPYAGKKGEYHAFVNSYIHGNNGNSPSVFPYEEAELSCLRKLIEIVKNK